MRFLSAADTEQAVDWETAIGCMDAAYATEPAPGAVPGRLIAAEATAWIRCLPAIPPGGRFMGTKQISRTRDGHLTYLITLYDRAEGRLAWLIDAVAITAMRTAATTAAALGRLAAGPAWTLAVLGSGLEATKHIEALSRRHPIGALAIFSPTAANRERLAERMSAALGIPARAARSAEEAVADAAVIVAAARSRGEQPILFGDWLAPGAIVASIGSTIPIQREIDVSVVARADLVVADVPHEVAADTGDMIAATQAGVAFRDKLYSLHDLMLGRIPAALLAKPRAVLFKSVGSALQDIAIAELVAERAARLGLGTALDIDLHVKQSIGRTG